MKRLRRRRITPEMIRTARTRQAEARVREEETQTVRHANREQLEAFLAGELRTEVPASVFGLQCFQSDYHDLVVRAFANRVVATDRLVPDLRQEFNSFLDEYRRKFVLLSEVPPSSTKKKAKKSGRKRGILTNEIERLVGGGVTDFEDIVNKTYPALRHGAAPNKETSPLRYANHRRKVAASVRRNWPHLLPKNKKKTR